MNVYNVADWYWFVDGHGPHLTNGRDRHQTVGTVYSSARGEYVPITDARYLAWRDDVGPRIGAADPTTRIANEGELQGVLTAAGLRFKP